VKVIGTSVQLHDETLYIVYLNGNVLSALQ